MPAPKADAKATKTEAARSKTDATDPQKTRSEGAATETEAARPAAKATQIEERRTETDVLAVTSTRRALAAGASLVPGLLVHGSGHWVLGERDTAGRLLLFEGVGLGALVVSLSGLALTGASRYFVAPLAAGAVGGAGMFGITWLADVYGVLAPDGGTGAPTGVRPRLAIATGIRVVHDPRFPHDVFVSHGFTVDAGPLWLSPTFDIAVDAPNRRYALDVGRRLIGATAAEPTGSGTALDVVLGVADHAYDTDRFSLTTLELSLAGRLELASFARTLRGSFAEASLGYARHWYRYAGLEDDPADALLARVGFGIYIGHGNPLRGEATVAYDHRRDTLAGGLLVPGIGVGYLGFFEQRTELFFARGVGAALELAAGSALVGTTQLLLDSSLFERDQITKGGPAG
nr:MAG: hypothetical protein DIU78_21535 [Pseudomonadota bacterium]